MAVHAEALGRTGSKGREIGDTVREQLRIIDERLTRHDKTWGRNVVLYDLPVAFTFPGLSKANAQRLIYSGVIRSLEERGFEVRIVLEPEPERSTLAVMWVTDVDKAEIEAMSAVVKKARISREELYAKYLAAPGEAPPPGAAAPSAAPPSAVPPAGARPKAEPKKA